MHAACFSYSAFSEALQQCGTDAGGACLGLNDGLKVATQDFYAWAWGEVEK